MWTSKDARIWRERFNHAEVCERVAIRIERETPGSKLWVLWSDESFSGVVVIARFGRRERRMTLRSGMSLDAIEAAITRVVRLAIESSQRLDH